MRFGSNKLAGLTWCNRIIYIFVENSKCKSSFWRKLCIVFSETDVQVTRTYRDVKIDDFSIDGKIESEYYEGLRVVRAPVLVLVLWTYPTFK